MKVSQRIKFTIVLLVLIISTPFALLRYYNYLLSPVSKEETTKRFVIKPGQPFIQIAKNLEEEKLVRNAIAFRLLVTQLGITNKIQAGDYQIPQNLPARELAKLLTFGAIDIWVTFPEGQRVEQQAETLVEKLKTEDNDKYQFEKEQYLKLADEGYMFPDTYLIPKDASASAAVEKLRGTFDAKVPKSLLLKGIQNNLTENQIVILASLIEREAKSNEERPIIAGILLNRIKAGMPLQVDATVQYAKGYDSANDTWWPNVTTADYASVKSPFNTYLNTGLPPGPICNPGLDSLTAAAQPADTDSLYYIHDAKGKIHYAKTIDEHEANVQKYL